MTASIVVKGEEDSMGWPWTHSDHNHELQLPFKGSPFVSTVVMMQLF